MSSGKRLSVWPHKPGPVPDPAGSVRRLSSCYVLPTISSGWRTIPAPPSPRWKEADQALRDLDDPTLVPVRQQLANDILALKSIKQPDVEGIALKLGSLAARVDTLRLSGMQSMSEAIESSAATQADSGFARIRRKIGEFFADIFRVRKTTGSSAPLLAPDEAFFLQA